MAPKGWAASLAARQMAAASSSDRTRSRLLMAVDMGSSANGLLGTVARAQANRYDCPLMRRHVLRHALRRIPRHKACNSLRLGARFA
jgi:hypothetical protein